MTTPGFLPAQRPDPSAYGEDLEDEFPIRSSKQELGAGMINPIKHDVSFLARVTALARVRVQNNGVATVLRGYAVDPLLVSVVRDALGKTTVTFPATVNVQDADATCNRSTASAAAFPSIEVVDPHTVKVHTSAVAGDADVDYLLSVY